MGLAEETEAQTPPESSDLLGEPVGLELNNVVRIHRMGEVAVTALRGVSLKIAPGEFVAIMGPSGCGKSTLLSLIGGLDRPTQGKIVAGGRQLDTMRDRQLADYRLQHVGTIFQSFNLISTLTALDNVSLPMTLGGIPAGQRRERGRRLLEKFGLKDRINFRPTRLSGGEQQRVSVARALANRPGLILADEPTGNLDEEAGRGVLDLIKEMHGLGATVVMVSHDPDVAAIADRIVRMRNGNIVEDAGTSKPIDVTPAAAKSQVKRLSWVDTARMGGRSVARRKLRTALSSAGVAIGIAAMAIIVSFSTGVQDSLTNAFAITGQLDQVSIGGGGFGLTDPSKLKPLNRAALSQLAALPHVKDAYGSLEMEGNLVNGSTTLTNVYLTSGSPLSETAKALEKFLAAGTFPTSDTANEVLISADAANKLGYTPSKSIGKRVTFSGQFPGIFIPGTGQQAASVTIPLDLTVVGVLSNAGNIGGGTAIFIGAPYQTAVNYWESMARANHWTADEFSSITLVSDSSGTVDTVAKEAKNLGYQATTTSDILKGFGQFITILEIGLSGLAAIALIVACLGIANTMYTAVLERTREIGIMKALGARSGDVRGMFMAEAAMIGLIGGAVGLLIAGLVSVVGNVVVNNIAHGQGIPLDLSVFNVTWWLVVGALILASAFSALSGLFPALRASRLDPVAALRYE
jgi:ABC-type lipoprotein export system ATPase subunit/ABC-type antimicrobial peptide transport system permease subunit